MKRTPSPLLTPWLFSPTQQPRTRHVTFDTSMLAYGSVAYALFCLCFAFPPIAFHSAGVTVEALFSNRLGDQVGVCVHRCPATHGRPLPAATRPPCQPQFAIVSSPIRHRLFTGAVLCGLYNATYGIHARLSRRLGLDLRSGCGVQRASVASTREPGARLHAPVGGGACHLPRVPAPCAAVRSSAVYS